MLALESPVPRSPSLRILEDSYTPPTCPSSLNKCLQSVSLHFSGCLLHLVVRAFFLSLSVSVSPSLSLSLPVSPLSLSRSLSLSFHPAEHSGGGCAINLLALFCPKSRKGEGLTLRGSYLLELLLVGPLVGMRSRGLAGR